MKNDPATESQKEKLRFFGCTWDAGITTGQASDALVECAKQFPDNEAAYQNRFAHKIRHGRIVPPNPVPGAVKRFGAGLAAGVLLVVQAILLVVGLFAVFVLFLFLVVFTLKQLGQAAFTMSNFF